MSKSIDQRGRIYLPKDIRERFGDQYRIVELPSHVALFPVDEDPLDGLRAAVGDAFAETTADELKTEAREAIANEVRAEADERSQEDGT
jgi:bifunctional DNA-binding transcriptional regulator/antitoxin component of YhaV-PrlF toxin-antitoxin module